MMILLSVGDCCCTCRPRNRMWLIVLVFAIVSFISSTLASPSTECLSVDRFLQASSLPDNGFHVQGWRWHTLALRRELDRLGKLSQTLVEQKVALTEADLEGLRTATEYTVNFNMRGLHRIESNVFFPWVRQRMEEWSKQSEPHVRPTAQSVLETVTRLEQQRSQIEQLGKSMIQTASRCSSTVFQQQATTKLLLRLSHDASTACHVVDTMRQQEDSIVCPILSRIVSRKAQQSLNSKVLRQLGLLDSRTHLVSMFEAVQDDAKEYALFQTTIPSIAQRLIPRWKRTLYEPRIGGLQRIP